MSAVSSPPPPQAAAAAAAVATSTHNNNSVLIYHQTIVPTQNVTHAVEGSFTLPNASDLVLVRHNVLELWTLHTASNALECVHTTPLFAAVYAIVAVPTSRASSALLQRRQQQQSSSHYASGMLDGAAAARARRDGVHYIAVTSETGYVTLLRYALYEPPIPTRIALADDGSSNSSATAATMLVTTSLRGRFVKVSEVCLGRSGARLTVPGARMAVDGVGEALFVAALMRNKVVVPLLRTNNNNNNSVTSSSSGLLGDGGDTDVVDNDGDGDGEDDENDNDDDVAGGSEGLARGRGAVGADSDAAARRRIAQQKCRQRRRGVLMLGGPLEVVRQTVTYAVCALDGAVDSTAFAALEEDVVEAAEGDDNNTDEGGSSGGNNDDGTTSASLGLPSPQQQQQQQQQSTAMQTRRRYLVVYAYVPSLQQVQRTHLVHVHATAHRLVAVPGAPCGPGGVLVCTDVDVTWYSLSSAAAQAATSSSSAAADVTLTSVFKCTTALPRRLHYTQTLYDPSIVQHAVACVARDFFMLLQNEEGDVFRVVLPQAAVQRAYDALRAQQQQQQHTLQQRHAQQPRASSVPNPLSIFYFDTLPVASAMVLFRRGCLFVASEGGAQHGLYKIIRNGYSKDSEYIVRRIKRSTRVASTRNSNSSSNNNSNNDVKTEAVKHEDKTAVAVLASGSVKRQRDKDDDDATMPAPAPRLLSRTVATNDDKSKALTTAAAATTADAAAAVTAATTVVVRVIALYQAHTQLRHTVLLRTYPNTPAITSFTTSIQGNTTTATAADKSDAQQQQQQQQQQHLCISAVAGRGVDSVLLLARYGYATRREAHYTLPTAYTTVLPLASATALQWLLREQQDAIAAATAAAATTHNNNSGSDDILGGSGSSNLYRHYSTSNSGSGGGGGNAGAATTARLRALRRLAASSSSGAAAAGVWTDKLLLSGAHGTSVYNVGATLESDTLSGFVSTEHTLAACTLRYGSGYVQVTTRGIHVLRAAPMLHASSSHHDTSATHNNSNNNSSSSSSRSRPRGSTSVAVEPVSWVHPHGRPILAAAASPTLVLVSFAQGGGLACFEFGHTSARLQQRDVAPTFAPAPALSLLQPPASSLLQTSAVQHELHALLFASNSNNSNSNSSSAAAPVQLAAVATMAREVHLLDPTRLRQPLATIERHTSSSSPITSVLLTYLGAGDEGEDVLQAGGSAENNNNNSGSSSSGGRRLFCFIGHLDGTLACCELDAATAQVLDTTTLTCGSSPCQLIAGDGERVCYVLCGVNAWRCDVYDGVVKVVPWRFAQRQTTFARFVAPTATQLRRLRRRTLTATSPHHSSNSSSGSGSHHRHHHGAAVVKRERERDDGDDDDGDAESAHRAAAAAGAGANSSHDGDDKDDNDDDDDDSDTSVLTLRGASGSGGGGGGAAGQRAEQVVALHERELSLYSALQGRAGGTSSSSLEYSFTHHALPVAGRRVLRHPTRPSYLILASAMHRGQPFAVTAAAAAAATTAAVVKTEGSSSNSGGVDSKAAAIMDARSLGKADVYASTLQLYHEDTHRLYPAYHFPDGDAVTSIAVGSFYADFGKEPVVIVATASAFTHGAHCGRAASCTQGWLRTFRCVTATATGAAAGYAHAGGMAAALYNSDGSAVLQLEPLHNTLLRNNNSSSSSSSNAEGNEAAAAAATTVTAAAADFASALHICEDVGLLFVGLGESNGLRVYGWGTQHLLRKRHLPNAPSRIIAIDTVFVSPPTSAVTSSATTGNSGSSSSSSSSSSLYYLADLYRCPLHKPDAVRRAREQQLLVVCATVSHSVFVASMQPGGHDTPSYLLRVAQDAVPRALTCMAVVDERTYAVGDRGGNVTFLRLPRHTRFRFAQPVEQLYDAEVAAAQAYMDEQQTLEQVASHATGQLVTSLQVQSCGASSSSASGSNVDEAGAVVRAVVYSTALGAVGAYVPFVRDEDAVLAAYVQPLLTARARLLLLAEDGCLPYHLQNGCGVVVTPPTVPSHNVIEGNLLQLYRQGGTTVYTTEAKMAIETELERVRRMDAARRRVLGLPPRELPSIAELLARQRALITLPQ